MLHKPYTYFRDACNLCLMDFSIISTHSHDCTKIIYIIQILAKYSKALSMNHIRSTQHIDEKKNKINYTIKLNQKTFIAILIENQFMLNILKTIIIIQECKYKTMKKSRRRMLGEAGSGPPQQSFSIFFASCSL